MLELRNPRIAIPVVLFAGILWSFGPLVVRNIDDANSIAWQYLFFRGTATALAHNSGATSGAPFSFIEVNVGIVSPATNSTSHP